MAANTTTRISGAFWIVLYFLANLALTIHNKWVMSRLRFSYPWILTAIHIGISGVGAYLALLTVYRQPPQPIINRYNFLKLFLFSILYAVNIAISNVSLQHVSLAFHQIIRSSTPAFTVAIEAGLFNKLPSLSVSLSLLPVMLGICLATADEFGRNGYTLDGFWLTVLGVLLSALKGIVTNWLLVGKLRLHPLDLLWKMSLSSALQCIVYSWSLGEMDHLKEYRSPNNRLTDSVIGIIANGLLAFVLNWVSFAANQKTSALSMTVAGNVKQALSIVLAVWIFATPVSALNTVGIIVTLIGGACYSTLVYLEKSNACSSGGGGNDFVKYTEFEK